MSKKYERYRTRFSRTRTEPLGREVNRKSLDRIGDAVLRCMDVAGDTPLPDKWDSMIEQIDNAYRENPEHLTVLLWRVLCDKTQALDEKRK